MFNFKGKTVLVTITRIPTTHDISNACLFLASDYALCITGIDIPVESGVLSAPPY